MELAHGASMLPKKFIPYWNQLRLLFRLLVPVPMARIGILTEP
jgi:hypothetical protein